MANLIFGTQVRINGRRMGTYQGNSIVRVETIFHAGDREWVERVSSYTVKLEPQSRIEILTGRTWTAVSHG